MKFRKTLLAITVAAAVPALAFASNSYELRVAVPGMKAPAPTVASPMFEFTTCGKNFQTGPSLSQCQSAYSGQSILDSVYNYSVSSGIQQWTVQETGKYRITAYGSWGGTPYDDPGNTYVIEDSVRGKGAKMSGDFQLRAGDVIKVVVGQSGYNTTGNHANGGGNGGGGSFVWVQGASEPLIAAGGGGGASIMNTNYDFELTKGVGGSIGINGLSANGTNSPFFGTNGNDADYSNGARGWKNMIGSMNFNGRTNSHYGGGAGFGGGGDGRNSHGAGGGGGYSGGDGGKYLESTYGGNGDGRNGGGGGGSYNAGTNQDNQAGVNAGLGKVVIEKY